MALFTFHRVMYGLVTGIIESHNLVLSATSKSHRQHLMTLLMTAHLQSREFSSWVLAFSFIDRVLIWGFENQYPLGVAKSRVNLRQ